MYCDIAENLADLVHYEATFERNTRLGPVLEDYYLDILNFYKEALAIFDRPSMLCFYPSPIGLRTLD